MEWFKLFSTDATILPWKSGDISFQSFAEVQTVANEIKGHLDIRHFALGLVNKKAQWLTLSDCPSKFKSLLSDFNNEGSYTLKTDIPNNLTICTGKISSSDEQQDTYVTRIDLSRSDMRITCWFLRKSNRKLENDSEIALKKLADFIIFRLNTLLATYFCEGIALPFFSDNKITGFTNHK